MAIRRVLANITGARDDYHEFTIVVLRSRYLFDARRSRRYETPRSGITLTHDAPRFSAATR